MILEGSPRQRSHSCCSWCDGYLYAGTGDGAGSAPASQTTVTGQKILRITTDGKASAGKPDDGRLDHQGHRNVQGLAFDGSQLYAAEFGQNKWDELNASRPGANYGRPAAEDSQLDGMVDPIAQWRTPDASPSGIAFAQGTIFGVAAGSGSGRSRCHGAS